MNDPTTRKGCKFVALHTFHDVHWILSTPTDDVDVNVVHQWKEWRQ